MACCTVVFHSDAPTRNRVKMYEPAVLLGSVNIVRVFITHHVFCSSIRWSVRAGTLLSSLLNADTLLWTLPRPIKIKQGEATWHIKTVHHAVTEHY